MLSRLLRCAFGSLLLLMLTGCDSNRIYENYTDIWSEGWSRYSPAQFSFNIEDTTQLCNLFINLRNTNDYPYMDLWLFTTMTDPTGATQTDTLRVMLADHKGQWIGSGFGGSYHNRIFYKEKYRFPRKGTYQFNCEQAMRVEPLIGIDNLGFRVEMVE